MFTDFEEKDESKKEMEGLKEFLLGFVLFVTLVLPIIWFFRNFFLYLFLRNFDVRSRKIIKVYLLKDLGIYRWLPTRKIRVVKELAKEVI